MKKKVNALLTVIAGSLLLSFTLTVANAQVVSIPDVNFKAALIAAGVDKNKDGVIQENEAMLVEKLEIAGKEIASLEGITAFKHLTFLSCGSNNLRSLHLSNNTELTDLACSNNKLIALDIAALVNLKRLICSMNKLTALDISHNKLTLLDCSYNQLTELDISANKELSTFTCSHNPLLTKIYIAGGINPNDGWVKDAGAKWLTGPTRVAAKPVVKTDLVPKDQIVSIPDEKFKAGLIEAGTDKNKDGNIQESEAAAVTEIKLTFKEITSLEGIGAFKNLKKLDCNSNHLTKLDVSNNELLTHLDCSANQLTSIDISKNLNLKAFSISNNQLTSIDISKNLLLTEFSCSYNHELTSLDVYNNTKLFTLNCSNTLITTLDVSTLVDLFILGCDNNRITTINLSKNGKLSMLNCSRNQLVELDVSQNPALDHLDCTNNESLIKIYIAPGSTPDSNWQKEYRAQWIKK